jgi:hypothetical protein
MKLSKPTRLSLFALEVIAFFGAIAHFVHLFWYSPSQTSLSRVSFSITEVLDAFMAVGLLIVLRLVRLG